MAVLTAVVLVVAKPWSGPAPVAPWAKTLGGTDYDSFDSVAVAPDGTIIAAGETYLTDGDFPGHGERDAVVAKLSPTGEVVWAKTLGGTDVDSFSSVAVAPDGSIIAAGWTGSTDGDFPATHASQDAVIAKLSPTGEMVWAKTLGGTDDDYFSSVAVAPDGSIIAAGYTDSSDGDFPATHGERWDAVIAKLSPTGEVIWAKTLGGTDRDSFFSVAVAPDGGIIAAGETFSTDGDFSATYGENDAVVAKLSPTGEVVWAKTLGGTDGDGFDSVAVAPDDGIMAAGRTGSTDGDFTATHGYGDAVIAKLSPTGEVVWAKTLGGTGADGFCGVGITEAGDIIAAGYTESRDGDFTATHGDYDAVIAKLSPDGTLG